MNVVLLQNATIEKLVNELLHADHANPVVDIVVMDTQPPSEYLQAMMELERYQQHLSFIQGSALNQRVS